ncbi:MAG: fibronectin type III domain-containing protein, partial [Longimicrobiales bacterium]
MKWTRKTALWGVMIASAMTLAACDEDPTGTVNLPMEPGNVAVAVTGTDLTVSWDAVANAESYDVTAATDGEQDRTQNVTETTATFTGLTEGATYAVQVTAVNEAGEASSNLLLVTIDESIELVTGDILTNTTWTSDKTYILTQPIFVGGDCGTDGAKEGCTQATLTIEPGTTILGRSDVPQGIRGAYLVVSRGSRLVADATGEDRAPTADEVIVFTSDRPRGDRARGDWGGLIINGQAPTNAGSEAQGEGDSGFYGGADDNDDSGILRGVRIEYAGDDVTPADQLNGLALQGVGAGTTISYLQIHYNTDDGIEPFGGTVSVDHLVVTGIGDDSVDGTDGYRGFMQFILGQQRGDNADRGFEISNNGDDGDAAPHTTAVIANATMIGARNTVVSGEIGGAESSRGVEFREGSRYRLYNTIIAGFNSGFRIADASTQVAAQNRMDGQATPDSTLSAEGIILHNNVSTFEDAFAQSFFETAGFNNMVADPGFDASVYDYGSLSSPPDFTLSAMP